MNRLWCLGVYESRQANYYPFFAPPILAERGPGGWRRVRYSIGRPYIINPELDSGTYSPLTQLSVFRGDYIACAPTRIGVTEMTLVVPGPEILIVRTMGDCILGVMGLTREVTGRIAYWRGALQVVRDYVDAHRSA